MVKSQAKTVVLLLSVRRPNSQVTPSRGSRMTVAFSIVLGYILYQCLYTVEPPNHGHVGTRHFVLYREVVLSSEVNP